MFTSCGPTRTRILTPSTSAYPEFKDENLPEVNRFPSLAEWHRNYHVRFLLIHGMNNHPFGFKDGKPQLAGLRSYHRASAALGYWNTKEKWLSKNEDYDERYASSEAEYQEIRQKLVSNAKKFQMRGFIDRYIKAAGYEAAHEIEMPFKDFSVIDHPKLHTGLGYCFKIKYAPPKDAELKPITFYVVSWNIWNSSQKEQAFGYFDPKRGNIKTERGTTREGSPFFRKHRLILNNSLKSSVMNWGLADASIYLSEEGYSQEFAVAKAVNVLGNDLGSDKKYKDRIAIVTESLGSTITVNALDKLVKSPELPGTNERPISDENRARFKKILCSSHSPLDSEVVFYMFANQYGLLNLTDLDERIFGERDELNIPLVSFHDPDDLLSFPLPLWGNYGKRMFENFVISNIYVKNPSYNAAFILRGPDKTHANYSANPKVLNLMLRGNKIKPPRNNRVEQTQ